MVGIFAEVIVFLVFYQKLWYNEKKPFKGKTKDENLSYHFQPNCG